MNKKIKILPFILIAVVILIGGIFIFSQKKGSINVGQEEESINNEQTETTVFNEEIKDKGSLNLGASFVCEYKEGGVNFTIYAKDKNIKAIAVLPNGDKTYTVFIGDKVYQWGENQKQGFVMDIDFAKKQPGTEIQDPEEYLKNLTQRPAIQCNPINVSNDTFTIPSDINFVDMSQLLNR